MTSPFRVPILALLFLCQSAWGDCVVVFDEVMYHPVAPDNATELQREWIELRNQMAVDIDLSGWRLARGVDFVFPPGTLIRAGAVLVVAADPAAFQTQTGVSGALGPWSGQLSNDGETIELRNNNQRVMDELQYGTDSAWPSAPDGGGASLSRKGRNLATNDSASWRSSTAIGGTPGAENFPTASEVITTTLIALNEPWKYQTNGTNEGVAWRNNDFADAAWSSGATTFHLGTTEFPAPATGGAPLPAGPLTYYFRRAFLFNGSPAATSLRLRLLIDDGAAIYLNGSELLRLNLPGTTITHDTPALNPRRGASAFQEFDVPSAFLRAGDNVLAAELHQAANLPSYPAAVLASGPIAYWRFGESTGPLLDLADLATAPESGAQNGGVQGFNAANVAMAGIRPADGFIGFDAGNAAPSFQGNDDGGDDVFTFADGGLFNFSSTRRFTVEGWVKAASAQEDGAAIFCKGTGGGGEQFCLDVVGGRYRLFVRDGAGAAVVAQSNVAPSNLWQHVAIVYDQSAAIMRLYVNGSVAVSGTPPATLLNTTHEVSVGARKGTSAPGYTLNLKGFVDETAIYNRALTPAEISAHYAAATIANPGGIETSDALFNAELVATETLPAATAARFVFNEISTGAIELLNAGSAPVDLANYTLVRTGGGNYTTTALPSQIIAPGSFASLAFLSNPGDRLVLVGNASRVADSVEVKATPRARRPDGSGEWLVPSMPTPGAANVFQLRNEIVINEIMFDHPAAALLPVGTERAGQWIELHNRSNAAVDLGGWSIDGGITFAFPAGASLAAGEYVVVAENPAGIIAVHAVAAAKVFGPWSGNLSHSHDRLILNDPTGNPADEVSFFDSGSWPEEANAGGSSLELRDPRADNRRGEAWAASDELTKAGWQTFTWRGQNSPSQPGEPTLWRELDLLLVDGPGECLVDDVRVTDLTTGTNLIQNGAFDEGAAHWRLLGNHRRSRVEPEPGAAGNNVLHLIATGPGEYQGNQIESTFAGNQALVTGRQYEISLRARWLNGGARLNTRLYFNRLPRTNLLNIVANGGTPGAGNSRATPNIGPTYTALKHSPAVPAPAEPVTVEIDATDPQNVAALDLKYSIAGGAWQSTPMTASGDGHYIAVVPGQAAGTTVHFYVEGRDSSGALSAFPARGAASRALYRVRGSENGGALPLMRLIMTPADAAFLHAPVNTLSNEYLGATLIADGGDVYYDVGVRLKGSFVGRNTARVGFNISFPSDRLFRGVLDKIALDRSMHTAVNNPAELIIKHVANQAGGIPSMYDDLAYLAHPSGSYSGVSSIRLAAFEDEYLDSQFPDGSDGAMFEFEVLRWALATIDGNPESPKLPGNEGSGTGYANLELTDYGNDKEAYRWNALQTMGRDADDYTAMIGLGKMFALSGANFLAAARQRLDVDAWLRTLAFQSLVGPADAIYTGGNIHNFRLYFRPHDGRALYMPWDWDSAFQRGTNASLIGGGNIAKVVTAAADHTRRYNNHLHDIITTTYNSAYMGRWTQHYGTLAGQNYSTYLNYIAQRATFVLSQLPTTTAFAAAAGTVTNNGATTITGTANIAVALIMVNGLGYSPTWSSNTAWSITVPLAPGSNTLILRGVDLRGNDVPGATTTLSITNPNDSGWPALRLNEWLAENDGAFRDPIDNDSEDWFEIHNPTAQPVDLSGWKLSDDPAMPAVFVIPNGWNIPAGGYLLVWADNEPVQNPSPPLSGQSLHVPFRLDGDGDTLFLSAPDNRPIDQIAFGNQRANAAEGSYPDGNDATQRLTVPTPASANVFAIYSNVDLAASTPTFTITTTPGWRYQLETSTDFLGWTPAGDPIVATGRTLLFNLPPRADPARFFRVRISP